MTGLSGLPAAAGVGGSEKHADPRLEKSAHAFEASLMGELLKPMQQGNGLTGEDGEEGSGGALASFATESLARVISERGGFGIANRVLAQLGKESGSSHSSFGRCCR